MVGAYGFDTVTWHYSKKVGSRIVSYRSSCPNPKCGCDEFFFEDVKKHERGRIVITAQRCTVCGTKIPCYHVDLRKKSPVKKVGTKPVVAASSSGSTDINRWWID